MKLQSLALLSFAACFVAVQTAQSQTYITFSVPDAINGTIVTGLNDNGDVTGYWVDANKVSHGFVRSTSGTIASFDVPAGTLTQPFGINIMGAVTGYYYDRESLHYIGFIRDAQGQLTTFAVADALVTTPNAINANSEISGYASIDGYSGFLRSADGTITIFKAASSGSPSNNTSLQPSTTSAS